jgi:hypothetical protein
VVSAIPNQTLLAGRVVGRQRHPSVDRWDVVRLEVSSAADIATDPNLLRDSVGGELAVAVDRDELPEGDLEGWQFTGPVRLAGPDTVVAVPRGAGAGQVSVRPPASG